MNFVDMIFCYANVIPEKPAIIMADRIVTFRMMAAGIRSVEGVLQDKHLAPGEIVAVKIDSPVRHLIVTCALFRQGVVSVSALPKMDVSKAGVKLQAMITDGGPVSWTGTTYVASDDWFSQEPDHRASTGIGFPNPDLLCRIVLSPDTTAVSEVVGLSARVFEDRNEFHHRTLTIVQWDRMLVLVTLASSLGFGSAILALAYGHTSVFAFSALEALQLINLYEADLLVTNPHYLKEMVAAHRTNPIPTPSLKLIKFGGSALAPELVSELRARFCDKFLCGFGGNELGPIIFGPVDRLLDVPGAAGYLAPGVELEVIGENGNTLPAGSEGILRARTKWQGANLLKGPASDAEPQWIYTGNYGKVLADGVVVLSGLTSDLIYLSGKLVSPEPIEQALASFPGVEAAAALGRPSTPGRHELWIAIKAKSPIDTEAVKTYLASQNPDWIVTGVTLVDAMPRNEMGKLVRRRLREQLPVR